MVSLVYSNKYKEIIAEIRHNIFQKIRRMENIFQVISCSSINLIPNKTKIAQEKKTKDLNPYKWDENP